MWIQPVFAMADGNRGFEEMVMDADSDDEMYDFDIPPDEIRYEQEALGPIGTWEWVVGGRQPDVAPFRGKPGLSLNIERNAEMDYFNCFVDEEMLRHITTETNRYARQMLDNHTLAPHSRAQDWTPVTVEEMRTFLGLVVAMGLVKQRDIKDYWCVDDVTDTPFFRSVMSRNKFLLILQFLHLNDNQRSVPRDHPDHDKLFKVRPIYDMLADKCYRTYIPRENLALDEAMIAWRGNLSFKVYNPDKPDKFGIKMYEVCESESGYCAGFEIYTGKRQEVSEKGATYDIVMRLMSPFLGLGYKLYVDNYYSSPVLFQDLHNRKTAACGTLRCNRKGVPKELKNKKLSKGQHVAMHLRNGNLQVIKWKDKRDVVMLSTMHGAEFIAVVGGGRDIDVQKPEAVLDYNKHMGAVDRSDQMLQYQAFRRRTLKWWKKVFFHLFNLAVLNAYIVYKMYHDKAEPQRIFRKRLVQQLVGPHRAGLMQNPLPRREAAEEVRLIERHFPSRIPVSGKKKNPARLCVVCNQGTGKRKSPGDGRFRKETTYCCVACGVSLCVVPCFELYHTKRDYKRAYVEINIA